MSGHSAEERFVIVADARRRRSRAEKEAIVAELNGSGSTVSAMARKHNIVPSLLFRWRRQFGSGTAVATERSFVPVTLPVLHGGKSASPAGAGLGRIEIELTGGRRIRVDDSIDVTVLKRVIDTLEAR